MFESNKDSNIVKTWDQFYMTKESSKDNYIFDKYYEYNNIIKTRDNNMMTIQS